MAAVIQWISICGLAQLPNATRSRFISPLAHASSPKRPRLTPSHVADSLAPAQGSKGGNKGEEVEGGPQQLVREKKLLEHNLKEKEGQLSKLRLVRLYRSKVGIYKLSSCINSTAH